MTGQRTQMTSHSCDSRCSDAFTVTRMHLHRPTHAPLCLFWLRVGAQRWISARTTQCGVALHASCGALLTARMRTMDERTGAVRPSRFSVSLQLHTDLAARRVGGVHLDPMQASRSGSLRVPSRVAKACHSRLWLRVTRPTGLAVKARQLRAYTSLRSCAAASSMTRATDID